MSTNDKYVSPYLLRPPGSQEDVMRERAAQARNYVGRESPEKTFVCNEVQSPWQCDANAAPHV